jgi:hypothetical protein
MERFAVEGDQAFQMLVHSSRNTNVKLVDVARWLTTGAGRRQAAPGGRRSYSPGDALG